MTKVDFYVLQSVASAAEREQFACRLVNKAFKQGHSVYINTDDQTNCERLDELLWCEPVTGFIPHSMINAGAATVNIGCGTDPGTHSQVLLNLAGTVPNFFSRFQRVVEIVVFEPHIRELTRANYKFYKDRGVPLNTHNIA